MPIFQPGAPLDTTDIPQPLGTSAAGAGLGGAAPSDHVHAMPSLSTLSDQDVSLLANGTVPTWNATAGKFVQTVPAPSAALVPLWQTLTSGIPTLPRVYQADSASFSATPASGVEHFTFFRADKSMTVGHIQFQTGGTAASGITYAAVGLYTVSGSALTLVASSSVTTTFSGSYANQSRALASGYAVVTGTIYAVGILQVGTTPASVLGAWYNAAFLGSAPSLAGTAGSGLTALAASEASTSVQQFPFYYELVA
jgi:hypothetical protein